MSKQCPCASIVLADDDPGCAPCDTQTLTPDLREKRVAALNPGGAA